MQPSNRLNNCSLSIVSLCSSLASKSSDLCLSFDNFHYHYAKLAHQLHSIPFHNSSDLHLVLRLHLKDGRNAAPLQLWRKTRRSLGRGKENGKISYGVLPSLCRLLMLCVWPSALSSSGMSLKATICWSICLPLAPCTTASLLSMMRPGLSPAHPLCCYPNAVWESGFSVCGGAGGSARLLSNSHQRDEIGIDRVEIILCTHTWKRLMSLEQLLSNLCLSKLNVSFLTQVQKHTVPSCAFLYFRPAAESQSIPTPPPLWPLGLKHKELVITWGHTPWNR